tara:strand:+ start:8988 stop:9668 length:681 start_codon:yes stop_codon:yes gene_type:complete
MREIVLDTETTGLNYKNGDRIIEVGCVETKNYVATGKTLSFYCRVDKEISEEAKKISGISNEFLKDKKTFAEHHGDFVDFIKNDPLIIHNAAFDLGFINNELKLIGKEGLKNDVIDTVSLARKVLNTRIANLDYLCRHFNIDLSKRELHGALLDAELLAEVYLELRGGKQITMDLLNKEKNQNNKLTKSIIQSQNTTKTNITEEDLRSHKLMLNEIKKPLWKKYHY